MIPNLFRGNRALGLLKVGEKMIQNQSRKKIYYKSGALKPKPIVTSFGVLGIFCTVIPGLLVGAYISKNIAAFLEENDLFIPSDDDDED